MAETTHIPLPAAEVADDANVPAESPPAVDVPAESLHTANVSAGTRHSADASANANHALDVPEGTRRDDAHACAEAHPAVDVPAEIHHTVDVPVEAHHTAVDVSAETNHAVGVPAETPHTANVPAETRHVPAQRAPKPAEITWTRSAQASSHRRRPGSESNEPDLGDALVAVAESFLAEGVRSRSGPERTQLFVHLRQRNVDAHHEPWRPLLHDGTLLSGDTFRRLACDAGLVLAHVDDAGNPLDVGRKTRTIPTSLRRALWVRDGGCRFPGCGAQIFVDAHHVQHWSEGGATSIDNTLLLCDHHHRAVHEDGFSVSILDGVACFRDPRGRAIPLAPQPPRLRDNAIQSLAARHHQRGIAIGPRTNLPAWDGTPLDRGAAVGALIRKTPPPASMHH